jgi:saccharopine dehydrogenase-like NADP-dependent oxidoreductase
VADADALTKAVQPFDLILGAVPGSFGYQMLKTVLKAGKRIVDISFAPENALDLNDLAKQHNAMAIVDMGVAPGLSNLLLGHHNETMQVERFVCQVGGLPVGKKWPYQYKAPFSPIDVIEEYTRPARIMRNNKIETLPALAEPVIADFKGVGELESFITDGLRSLLFTMNIPNMEEKTLRYKGHRELMEIFRETGLFSTEEITVNGNAVRPLDVTATKLLPHWFLEENESEFTVMEIKIEGIENKEKVRYTYFLLDYFDPKTGLSSMARTTGFTCASAARMVLETNFDAKGIFPPELLAKDIHNTHFILERLKTHHVAFEVERKVI